MKTTKRQLQKEQTRKHLINIALAEFAKKGFITTKTADIAGTAGVSHGSVFAHFKSKEVLVSTVIEHFTSLVTENLHNSVVKNNSLKEALHAHLHALQKYEQLYTRLISENKLLPEEARNSYVSMQSAIAFHVNEIAEKEMKNSKIKSMPSSLLFNTWLGLVHHYLMNSDLFSPNQSVLESHGEILINHFINLIKI